MDTAVNYYINDTLKNIPIIHKDGRLKDVEGGN